MPPAYPMHTSASEEHNSGIPRERLHVTRHPNPAKTDRKKHAPLLSGSFVIACSFPLPPRRCLSCSMRFLAIQEVVNFQRPAAARWSVGGRLGSAAMGPRTCEGEGKPASAYRPMGRGLEGSHSIAGNSSIRSRSPIHFRQTTRGDWGSVFKRMEEELVRMARTG